MRDQLSYESYAVAINDVAHAATFNGNSIDVNALNNGNNALTFVFFAGIITDGTHVFTLYDSPDNVTFTAVAANETLTHGTPTFNSATAVGAIASIAYLGQQRYVRATSTIASPTTGGVYGALAVLALPNTLPAV